MTTREVVLDGGSPWGFRLHGGADLNQPLRISRVNPGSKAALRGIREGDFITSINGQSTKDLTNAEAHSLLKNSGDALTLGLNEDCSGSPKRRQYKTVHQETHSETVKRSSTTSYTLTSSKTISESNISGEASPTKYTNTSTILNGNSKDTTSRNNVVSQRSTLSSCSSSASTPTTSTDRGPEIEYTSSHQELHQNTDSRYRNQNSDNAMADNAVARGSKAQRRRARNQRRKSGKFTALPAVVIETETVVETVETKEVPAEYRVDSPKFAKATNGTAKEKMVKSKSLDDDEAIRIQELSEVSDAEATSATEAVVSEAESDIEPSTSAEAELITAPLISPEEELTLRNFLEELNLVNSPEDAVKHVYEKSTMDSIKVKKARKRAALDQYFGTVAQNPRFLGVIREEHSNNDPNERGQQKMQIHHIKRGTPELEIPAPREPSVRKRKLQICKFPLPNPVILVDVKEMELPKVHRATFSQSMEAEVVFLEESSDSNDSGNEEAEEAAEAEIESRPISEAINSSNCSCSSLSELQEEELVQHEKELRENSKDFSPEILQKPEALEEPKDTAVTQELRQNRTDDEKQEEPASDKTVYANPPEQLEKELHWVQQENGEGKKSIFSTKPSVKLSKQIGNCTTQSDSPVRPNQSLQNKEIKNDISKPEQHEDSSVQTSVHDDLSLPGRLLEELPESQDTRNTDTSNTTHSNPSEVTSEVVGQLSSSPKDISSDSSEKIQPEFLDQESIEASTDSNHIGRVRNDSVEDTPGEKPSYQEKLPVTCLEEKENEIDQPEQLQKFTIEDDRLKAAEIQQKPNSGFPEEHPTESSELEKLEISATPTASKELEPNSPKLLREQSQENETHRKSNLEETRNLPVLEDHNGSVTCETTKSEHNQKELLGEESLNTIRNDEDSALCDKKKTEDMEEEVAAIDKPDGPVTCKICRPNHLELLQKHSTELEKHETKTEHNPNPKELEKELPEGSTTPKESLSIRLQKLKKEFLEQQSYDSSAVSKSEGTAYTERPKKKFMQDETPKESKPICEGDGRREGFEVLKKELTERKKLEPSEVFEKVLTEHKKLESSNILEESLSSHLKHFQEHVMESQGQKVSGTYLLAGFPSTLQEALAEHQNPKSAELGKEKQSSSLEELRKHFFKPEPSASTARSFPVQLKELQQRLIAQEMRKTSTSQTSLPEQFKKYFTGQEGLKPIEAFTSLPDLRENFTERKAHETSMFSKSTRNFGSLPEELSEHQKHSCTITCKKDGVLVSEETNVAEERRNLSPHFSAEIPSQLTPPPTPEDMMLPRTAVYAEDSKAKKIVDYVIPVTAGSRVPPPVPKRNRMKSGLLKFGAVEGGVGKEAAFRTLEKESGVSKTLAGSKEEVFKSGNVVLGKKIPPGKPVEQNGRHSYENVSFEESTAGLRIVRTIDVDLIPGSQKVVPTTGTAGSAVQKETKSSLNATTSEEEAVKNSSSNKAVTKEVRIVSLKPWKPKVTQQVLQAKPDTIFTKQENSLGSSYSRSNTCNRTAASTAREMFFKNQEPNTQIAKTEQVSTSSIAKERIIPIERANEEKETSTAPKERIIPIETTKEQKGTGTAHKATINPIHEDLEKGKFEKRQENIINSSTKSVKEETKSNDSVKERIIPVYLATEEGKDRREQKNMRVSVTPSENEAKKPRAAKERIIPITVAEEESKNRNVSLWKENEIKAKEMIIQIKLTKEDEKKKPESSVNSFITKSSGGTNERIITVKLCESSPETKSSCEEKAKEEEPKHGNQEKILSEQQVLSSNKVELRMAEVGKEIIIPVEVTTEGNKKDNEENATVSRKERIIPIELAKEDDQAMKKQQKEVESEIQYKESCENNSVEEKTTIVKMSTEYDNREATKSKTTEELGKDKFNATDGKKERIVPIELTTEEVKSNERIIPTDIAVEGGKDNNVVNMNGTSKERIIPVELITEDNQFKGEQANVSGLKAQQRTEERIISAESNIEKNKDKIANSKERIIPIEFAVEEGQNNSQFTAQSEREECYQKNSAKERIIPIEIVKEATRSASDNSKEHTVPIQIQDKEEDKRSSEAQVHNKEASVRERIIPIELAVEEPTAINDCGSALKERIIPVTFSKEQEKEVKKSERQKQKDSITETSKEIERICGNLPFPANPIYSKKLTSPNASPPPSSFSSSSSSRATSLCTAVYNPIMASSIGDVESLLKDEELLRKQSQSLQEPATLRELCLNFLLSQPFGADVLQELAEVSLSLQELTDNLSPKKLARSKQCFVNLSEAAKFSQPVIRSSGEDAQNLSSGHGNRLLAIIRNEPSLPGANMQQGSDECSRGDYLFYEERVDATLPEGVNNVGSSVNKNATDDARLKAKDLSEWLQLARHKSTSESNLKARPRAPTISNPQNHQEATNSRLHQRRTSLPPDFYQRQMEHLLEKEREIQRELEHLEDEKRKLAAEMEAAPNRRFHPDDFHISRKGDYAESKTDNLSKKDRPQSMPSMATEVFRQQMYDEYMEQIATREERKQLKVIKVTTGPQTATNTASEPSTFETIQATAIESEFMDKVKEKQKSGKLGGDAARKEDSCSSEPDKILECQPQAEEEGEPVLVIDGDSLKGAQILPKHLREFVVMTKQATAENSPEISSSDGVWSPGQKQQEFNFPEQSPNQYQQRDDDPISPVWTPKSANSSPTVGRKEFRPVKFESPVLSRKSYARNENNVGVENHAPTWKTPETSSDTGVVLSSALQKRLPTSYSSPASGFGDFSSTSRLPKAQNPTVTLLQKAREGQLPRGAVYLDQPDHNNYRRPPNERPRLGPGEVLYHIKNEYTSESDSEKPRKMADLGPRKFEGVGPTTKDGMPLILRSEVKDANQSKWYKRMYDTIHKQKPHRDEYVTVRYKQRRGQYPYSSGYLSEPEPGVYDSDFADYKYATLDRRRVPVREKENAVPMSSTMPRNTEYKMPTETSVIRPPQNLYRSQPPGRIENYRPGHSSISDKEAKEWWDEVMDIFDGHLEQQKYAPQPKSFINQALKESGYESDSTLVFRRRDDTAQQLSPLEQKEAYKVIQKGGDVPLHGLRKLAPEKPKEPQTRELEYFPISPTLTRVRIHKNIQPQKEILCYPVTVHPHPSTIFAKYKRTAPSSSSAIPKAPPMPPSPPRRRSSRNNSTLRLISTMKVKTEKSPLCRRHETCFTTNTNIDNTNVKFLRDKITCKLSPRPRSVKTERDSPLGSAKAKVSTSRTSSPDIRSKIISTVVTSSSSSRCPGLSRVQSRTSVSSGRSTPKRCQCSQENPCKKCGDQPAKEAPKPRTTSASPLRTSSASPLRTFATEKRKVDLVLPKSVSRQDKKYPLVPHSELLSPTEVKKALSSQTPGPSGVVYKKSVAPVASAKSSSASASTTKYNTLPIKVGISDKGRSIFKNAVPKASGSSSTLGKRTKSTSTESLQSPTTTRKIISTIGKSLTPKSLKQSKTFKSTPSLGSNEQNKKLKKSKKEKINGEIAKKTKQPAKEVPVAKGAKCAGKAAGTEIARRLREMSAENESEEFGSTSTLADDIQKQKDAIQSDSAFFQHLLLRDMPSPTPSVLSKSSWYLDRALQHRFRKAASAEPTISAMKVYLSHRRPVTESKFKSLDVASVRSRSASPKSVTWERDPPKYIEKRSSSLPPKLMIFSQTSRPVSPKIERRRLRSPSPPPSPRYIRSPSSRKIMYLRNNAQPVESVHHSRDDLERTERRERSKSPQELIYLCHSLANSTTSLDSQDSNKDYQAYVRELLRSSRRSTHFRDLNNFYSAIEKFGKLEQTASSLILKPRGKYEEEIIDYDRWKEVRARERAERELKTLFIQLKEDQKEKGFLFQPKDISNYRWKKELDRGLRIKDKSVENIKDAFEKIKEEEPEREATRRRELMFLKDTYKPLWRGSSVVSLASSMGERRSQSEGRVTTARQRLVDSERMLTHGIGSRLWSSLSMEQVNVLKNQLSEIYSQNLKAAASRSYEREPPEEYSIQVPKERSYYQPSLTVRRNSDSSDYSFKMNGSSKTMSELDKKQLSQTLSREVLSHMSQKKKNLPLVLARETRGATAAAAAAAPLMKSHSIGSFKPIEPRRYKIDDEEKDFDSKEPPQKALVKTDATTQCKLPSNSETESGSTDESSKTIIFRGNRHEDIKKKVDYFESASDQQKYAPTIYQPSESHYDIGKIESSQKGTEVSSLKRKPITSQSYQDLKELFGETELVRFATLPLAASRKTIYVSPERPQLRATSIPPSPPISEAPSVDSVYRSRSLSPYYFEEPQALLKSGEVRRLKNHFEYSSNTYPPRLTFRPRRCRSDPNIQKASHSQIFIPGQTVGDVEFLRSKYEYPAYAGRGRSRTRRGGVISPTFLRAEDRFMPHINIISKIANLYGRKGVMPTEKSTSTEELARILGCPAGEVEKLRQKFDSNISLLGHMFTSSPNIRELRDIAPYLTASWIAHRYPRTEDNTRSLSSPDSSIGNRDTTILRRDRQRPKSISPPRSSKACPILKTHQDSRKKFDPKVQPLYRYQPEPVRYKSWWTPTHSRPSVSFQGVVFKLRNTL